MGPRVTLAQPVPKVARIGILGLAPTADLVGPEPKSPSTRVFLRGLRELGYVYGEHFVTEARGAEAKPEHFPRLVAELQGRPGARPHDPAVAAVAGGRGPAVISG